VQPTISTASTPPTSNVDAAQASERWRTYVGSVSHTAGGAGLVAMAYIVLAVLFTWPLAAHLSDAVTSSVDPVDSIWRIGWGQERLLHAPHALFSGNTFYPFANSYLFDECVLGVAVLTLPLAILGVAPLVTYNIAVLFTLALCGITMYALARHLGAIPLVAFVAGVIYAFAPLHLDHIGHIGVLSIQWFPLILLLIDRILTRPTVRDSVALAASLAMQAISSQYHALYLVLLVPLFLGVMWVCRPETRRLRIVAHLTAAGFVALALVAPVAINYLRIQADYEVIRSYGQTTYYSASLANFITPDGHNRLWGALTAPLRANGTYTFERGMFAGGIALLLAVVGAVIGIANGWRSQAHTLATVGKPASVHSPIDDLLQPPRARLLPMLGAQYPVSTRAAWVLFLVLLTLTAATLALGPELRLVPGSHARLFGHLPYDVLYWHVPGINSMRVPARIGALYLLGIAGLAAIGLTILMHWLDAIALPRPRFTHLASLLGGIVVLLGVCLEYANVSLPLTPLESGAAIPPVYTWLAAQPDATVVELPLLIPDHQRSQEIVVREQYFSLVHRHPLVNGNATVLPKGYKSLALEMRDLSSPRAMALLQGLGITHIVMHYDQLQQTNATRLRELLANRDTELVLVAQFPNTEVYRVAPTARFMQLRAVIPSGATVALSRDDPMKTGGYMAMIGYVLRDHPLYANLRVDFGQNYRGPVRPDTRYDCAVLFSQEDPATLGFTPGDLVWQDDISRVYRH